MIIVLEGADGTGKTTLANEIVKQLDAGYVHLTYRFKKNMFAYQTWAMHKALRHVATTGKPFVIDRHWISENIYADEYRGGTKWPLSGRFFDRVMNKVGGIYIFCLHDGTIEDYKERYKKLKEERFEMYSDTSGIAQRYCDFFRNIEKESRSDIFRYSIGAEGRDLQGFVSYIEDEFSWRHDTGNRLRTLTCNNQTGSIFSNYLILGDQVCKSRLGKEPAWPFHKYQGGSLLLTQELENLNVPERDLCWVNIHGDRANYLVNLWCEMNPSGKILCLGEDVEKTFKKMKIIRPYTKAIHPACAYRFHKFRNEFTRQLKEFFNENKIV